MLGGSEDRRLGKHAFILEDDYLISQALQDMLERLGFSSFSFARSEDAAVFGASAQKIDLITADVRLLPGDGLRAVEAICTRRQVPTIFITGYADELKDRAPGATVIQKPINEQELSAAVRKALGEDKASRHK
jgi:DNA-binding response OmpR family regulator